jgi:heptosyltransferase I
VKILILKPSSLGDVVQALPVLRLIKRHLPASEIYWWIDSRLAPLLEGDPDLTGIVRFERQRWAAPRNWGELVSSIRWVRNQRFDWVIDLQCLARSGLFGWFSNGGLMVGLDETREGARAYYDLAARRPTFQPHAVAWYLEVLPFLNVPIHTDFQWLPPRPEVVAALHQKWPMAAQRPWLAIQPGARWMNKRWPAESFATLAGQLGATHPDLGIAILGGSEDRELGELVSRGAPDRCLDLTGRLSLLEMVEWIRLSRLMVSNDTGPLHVAAAVGTPVVALFGPTDPRQTGPYGQLENVLQLDLPCVPCQDPRCRYAKPQECLRALAPAKVVEVVHRQLSRRAVPPCSTRG